jgi:hypothetical protein
MAEEGNLGQLDVKRVVAAGIATTRAVGQRLRSRTTANAKRRMSFSINVCGRHSFATLRKISHSFFSDGHLENETQARSWR